ncbi:MAG: hypothetical protein EBR09_02590 [Proteobacteria bacterium]|nr:hypothetical protein [Pseudomonadota bacterium]
MRGLNLKQFFKFFGLLVLISGCARGPVRSGENIPVKISVEIADTGSTTADTPNSISANGLFRPEQPLDFLSSGASEVSESAGALPDPSGSGGGAGGAGGAGGTGGTSESELNRILTSPERLISEGPALFKIKRVFRWLSFRISRGTQILKEGSAELRDPQILEIAPFEVDAMTGDPLSVAVSLFQADFMTASDADSLCQKGAPALIRTWSGATNSVVEPSGALSLKLENAGQTTVHMAAVGFGSGEFSGLNISEFRHVLTDRLTGQTFGMQDASSGDGLCKVHELPAAGTTSGLRFLKLMSFSGPLRTHALGLYSPRLKTMLIPSGRSEVWSSADDKRAAAELGITLSGKSAAAADGSRSLVWTLPSAVLGTGWQAIRPEVVIGDPNLTLVNSSARVEFPLRISGGARLNFNAANIIQPAGGPSCSVRFTGSERENNLAVGLEQCQGNGAFLIKLAEGTVVSESGTQSLPVASPEIMIDNTAPSLSIISPPLESFVGSSFQITGACEGGASKVALHSSGMSSIEVDCAEYIPNVYQFLFAVNAAGHNGARDYKITQGDAAGNMNAVQLRVSVDSLPPAVTVSPSVTAMRTSGTVVYTLSATDPPESSGGLIADLSGISLVQSGIAGCSKTVDSSAKTVTVTACTGDGTLSLSLPAGVFRDLTGNQSVSAISAGPVTVDNTGPALNVTSPAPTQWLNSSFSLNGSCEFGGTSVTITTSSYLTAGSTSVTCAAAGTFSTTVSLNAGAPDGTSHSVTLNQSDALGNPASFTRSINLDRTIPTISVSPAGPVYTNTSAKTFTFTGSDSGGSGLATVDVSLINMTVLSGISGCSIARDNSAKTVTVSGCTGNASPAVTINVPAGAVRDAAGNDSVAYPSIVTLNVDNTPPAPTLSPIGTTTVASTTVSQTLTGICNYNDGAVQLTGDVVSQTTSCVSGGSYSFSSFELTAGGGAKNIRVRQTDAAGNTGESGTRTIELHYITPPVINSPSNFTGMGLRPYFSGTCDSATGNVTTLTATIGRKAFLQCVSGQLFGMLSLPFSNTASVTITLTTTHTPSGASVSTNRTFTTDGVTACPTGFVKVSGLGTHITQLGNTYASHGNLRAWLDTGQDFCVMKFQAKESGATSGTIGLNYYSHAPWTDINRTDAMNKCRNLCSSGSCNDAMTLSGVGSLEQSEFRGYRLISNTQWQVIARTILQQDSNWTGGAVGTGTLYQGHTDSVPASALSNGPDNVTEPTAADREFYGTGQISGPQRRVHYLTGSDYIFDFSGNKWQWVSDDRAGGTYPVGLSNPLPTTAGWYELTSAAFSGNFSSVFGSESTYNSAQLTGMAEVPSTLGTAIIRGGYAGFSTSTAIRYGIFATDFSRAPATAYPDVSFRCVFVP